MDSGNPAALLRFIKKIPNSGGAPAYKLTLPHQIVNRHLQHLIGKGFELASSSSSTQTWEGSLSSRRNKLRAEYVLQGWKLFAEAHQLQAGDQVSFELMGRNRLVVKCIQPAGAPKPPSLIRSTTDSPNLSDHPSMKSIKTSGGSSPSRPSAHTFQPDKNFLQDYNSIAPETCGVSPAQRRCLSSSPRSVACSDGSPMVHHVQSWLTQNIPSPPARQCLSAAPVLLEENGRGLSINQSSSISPKAQNASHPSFIDHLQLDLPGIFDDMSQDLDSVVPDIPPSSRLGLEDDTSLRSLCSSLNNTVTQHVPQSLEEQSYESEKELRALVSNIQDRLDRSARTALQATMGLENCVLDIVNPAAQRDIREVQAKMFHHLSSLKESLWQCLVVANNTPFNDQAVP